MIEEDPDLNVFYLLDGDTSVPVSLSLRISSQSQLSPCTVLLYAGYVSCGVL